MLKIKNYVQKATIADDDKPVVVYVIYLMNMVLELRNVSGMQLIPINNNQKQNTLETVFIELCNKGLYKSAHKLLAQSYYEGEPSCDLCLLYLGFYSEMFDIAYDITQLDTMVEHLMALIFSIYIFNNESKLTLGDDEIFLIKITLNKISMSCRLEFVYTLLKYKINANLDEKIQQKINEHLMNFVMGTEDFGDFVELFFNSLERLYNPESGDKDSNYTFLTLFLIECAHNNDFVKSVIKKIMKFLKKCIKTDKTDEFYKCIIAVLIFIRDKDEQYQLVLTSQIHATLRKFHDPGSLIVGSVLMSSKEFKATIILLEELVCNVFPECSLINIIDGYIPMFLEIYEKTNDNSEEKVHLAKMLKYYLSAVNKMELSLIIAVLYTGIEEPRFKKLHDRVDLIDNTLQVVYERELGENTFGMTMTNLLENEVYYMSPFRVLMNLFMIIGECMFTNNTTTDKIIFSHKSFQFSVIRDSFSALSKNKLSIAFTYFRGDNFTKLMEHYLLNSFGVVFIDLKPLETIIFGMLNIIKQSPRPENYSVLKPLLVKLRKSNDLNADIKYGIGELIKILNQKSKSDFIDRELDCAYVLIEQTNEVMYEVALDCFRKLFENNGNYVEENFEKLTLMALNMFKNKTESQTHKSYLYERLIEHFELRVFKYTLKELEDEATDLTYRMAVIEAINVAANIIDARYSDEEDESKSILRCGLMRVARSKIETVRKAAYSAMKCLWYGHEEFSVKSLQELSILINIEFARDNSYLPAQREALEVLYVVLRKRSIILFSRKYLLPISQTINKIIENEECDNEILSIAIKCRKAVEYHLIRNCMFKCSFVCKLENLESPPPKWIQVIK
ncbi:uncharacterized protein LOC119688261 [Teleopsis dalmanni]|uniref:uncharacterized protein LOC119688261 n=1 Tax=Teleopsis dalmanni TaxID=139649 RepID=UPI0018CDF90B|nr:uncharacterized protein LOC119688261 [Teleopsis dalmanni]